MNAIHTPLVPTWAFRVHAAHAMPGISSGMGVSVKAEPPFYVCTNHAWNRPERRAPECLPRWHLYRIRGCFLCSGAVCRFGLEHGVCLIPYHRSGDYADCRGGCLPVRHVYRNGGCFHAQRDGHGNDTPMNGAKRHERAQCGNRRRSPHGRSGKCYNRGLSSTPFATP